MVDVMSVQLDYPDWRLWQTVWDPGLWYARRLKSSPPMWVGPLPLEQLPGAIAARTPE